MSEPTQSEKLSWLATMLCHALRDLNHQAGMAERSPGLDTAIRNTEIAMAIVRDFQKLSEKPATKWQYYWEAYWHDEHWGPKNTCDHGPHSLLTWREVPV